MQTLRHFMPCVAVAAAAFMTACDKVPQSDHAALVALTARVEKIEKAADERDKPDAAQVDVAAELAALKRDLQDVAAQAAQGGQGTAVDSLKADQDKLREQLDLLQKAPSPNRDFSYLVSRIEKLEAAARRPKAAEQPAAPAVQGTGGLPPVSAAFSSSRPASGNTTQRQLPSHVDDGNAVPQTAMPFDVVGIDSWGGAPAAILTVHGALKPTSAQSVVEGWTIEAINPEKRTVLVREPGGSIRTVSVRGD